MRNLVRNIFSLAGVMLFAVGCASSRPAEQPEAKAVADTQPAPAASTSSTPINANIVSYNVVRGDHLWGISSKPTIYGNPYQWPLIYKANRDKIRDADVIEPGWVLSIDKNPSAADVDAAVRHAKTRGSWSLNVTEEVDSRYLAGTRYGMNKQQ